MQKAIKDLEKKIENLETEKMVILENMNDVAQAKEQVENELLDKVLTKTFFTISLVHSYIERKKEKDRSPSTRN